MPCQQGFDSTEIAATAAAAGAVADVGGILGEILTDFNSTNGILNLVVLGE